MPLVKIRVRNCSEIQECHELKKFVGMVRIAEPVPGQDAFSFSFEGSSGFRGPHVENHIISSKLVDVLQ
ncbi:MAG: hypothetical protein ABH800_01950 [Candidatus Nealsonbacteria bacterium]|nr:hypothetical protein [Patescibacteria group bacterium]